MAPSGSSRPLGSFALLWRSRALRVPRCAHVPRVGLSPPLLLYFAPLGTPIARSGTSRGALIERAPPWLFDEGNGYWAQRSKGGGPGAAGPGGHERSPVLVGLVPPEQQARKTAKGRFQADAKQIHYSDMAGRNAICSRQRSRCGCSSPGLTFTTRAKSTATTAVMSAMLKPLPATCSLADN